jgi:hypothetical protein
MLFHTLLPGARITCSHDIATSSLLQLLFLNRPAGTKTLLIQQVVNNMSSRNQTCQGFGRRHFRYHTQNLKILLLLLRNFFDGVAP